MIDKQNYQHALSLTPLNNTLTMQFTQYAAQ